MALSKWRIQRSVYLLKYFGTGVILLAILGIELFDVKIFDSISLGAFLISVDLVVVAWLIVAVYGRILHNKWALVAFLSFLILFGIGVYGAQIGEEGGDGFGADVNKVFYPVVNTLSIFFPSRGDYQLEQLEADWEPFYYILHFLGYFFAVWFLFSMFGRKIISRTLCWIIGDDKKAVFWDYSLSGRVLAEDILRNDVFCQPVFVLPRNSEYDEAAESRLIDELMNLGALVVFADFDEKLFFNGKRHFFMSENQDQNVSLALKLTDQFNKNITHNKSKTHLHVRTEIEGIDAVFQAIYDDNESLKQKVEVNIYSQSDLAARSFVLKHPLLDLAGRKFKPDGRAMQIHADTASVSGECHVLLLGLGWSGFELLRKIVCDAQFLGEDFHFSVTVIDDDFQVNRGRYLRIFEAARRIGIEINVNPTIFVDGSGKIMKDDRSGLLGSCVYDGLERKNICSVNGYDFYQWLAFNDNILDFDRIIVSLGDDEYNTNTAMQLHTFRLSRLNAYHGKAKENMPEKIFVHVKDYRSYKFYKMNGSPIVPFGDFEEINSVDSLIREMMDKVAKMVNYVYGQYKTPQLSAAQLSDSDAIEKKWDENDTNLFNQNSSRSVALNVENTVRIAGGIDMLKDRLKDPFYLERYAEMEHKRWNAFNIMYGVDVWDKEEVTASNGKLKLDGVLVRHICIVDFDDLDEMSLKVRSLGNVNENYKETDRRIVRHFPMFYDIMNNKKTN